MAGLRVHVVMPESLVARIDSVLREGESRGAWVRRVVEQALADLQDKDPVGPLRADDGSGPAASSVGADPGAATLPGHAKAEPPVARPQPVSDVPRRSRVSRVGMRSSVEAKRDVKPVPKAAKGLA